MLENKDFYPTPDKLIEKMVEGLNFKMIRTVLEPSAGKGNIVESLQKEAKKVLGSWTREENFLDVDCIEKDQNLRHILKGNGMRVVHDDFLTYDTMKMYDLIIMNPPFSDGCRHLLKAMEMQEITGGAIVCLLNAETLKNQCSNDRILLAKKIEQSNGTVEYVQSAFMEAERRRRLKWLL